MIDSFERSKKEKNVHRAMVGAVPQPGAAVAHVGEDMAVHVLDDEGGGEQGPPPPDLAAGEVAGVVDALFAVVPLETDDDP